MQTAYVRFPIQLLNLGGNKMKSTGIVRRVDQLGRIVVPKEIRKNLNIVEAVDCMEIYLEDGMIVFKKFDGNVNTAGIVRRVDQLGRVVLPIELRRMLNIVEERDALEIFVADGSVLLKKYEPSCTFCGNIKDVFPYKGKNICENCIEEISKLK